MKDTMIGVDLAKNVFQFHGASMIGELQFRKKLSRGRFLLFMGSQPASLVLTEACGSANHWALELTAPGHEVKLIAPQYVLSGVSADTGQGLWLHQKSRRQSFPPNSAFFIRLSSMRRSSYSNGARSSR